MDFGSMIRAKSEGTIKLSRNNNTNLEVKENVN